MTQRDRRRRKPLGYRVLGEQVRKASLPLSAGLVAALVVSLVPAQYKAVTAAVLSAILIASAITVLSPGAPRAERRPRTQYPRWILAVTLMGVGATTILALRLPGNLTMGDALLAVALAGIIARPAVTATAIREMPGWYWWSTSLVLVSAVLATLRPEVTEPGNIATAFRTWAAMALLPFLIVVIGSSARRLHALVAAFVIGASLSALAAVAQAVGLWNPAATLGVQVFPGRATGLSVHPNHLGFASALAAPIALALALRATRPLVRYTWGAVWLVLALGVTTSGSRAALGGLLVGLALLIPVTIRLRGSLAPKRGLDLGLPLALIGMALVLWLLPRMASSTDSLLAIVSRLRSPDALAESNVGRVQYYGEGVANVSEYWLIGRGFEEATRDHNIFLQALLSGGILYLAGLLAYLWNPIIQTASRRYAARDPILSGALVSFLLWPMMGLTQNNLRDRYLFVALGLILAGLRAAPPDGSVGTSGDQNAATDSTVLRSATSTTPTRPSSSGSLAGVGQGRVSKRRARRP